MSMLTPRGMGARKVRRRGARRRRVVSLALATLVAAAALAGWWWWTHQDGGDDAGVGYRPVAASARAWQPTYGGGCGPAAGPDLRC